MTALDEAVRLLTDLYRLRGFSSYGITADSSDWAYCDECGTAWRSDEQHEPNCIYQLVSDFLGTQGKR